MDDRNIDDLKERVGIKKTIKDYGIDEQTFLDTLDEMVENAFDDQCTGANPRYPLMSEIKELYLKAYYGKQPSPHTAGGASIDAPPAFRIAVWSHNTRFQVTECQP